ncbi:Hypothetical protein A7982_08223 [Minicystis rosea]|nr:Hypothetical protein A7982_08223 [Minicystis rosea]
MEKTARAWTPEERAVVDLHVHYWTHVWSMNNFTLYNRYKKHLPAPARREADRLANAAALGNDEEIRGIVEGILEQTWDKEDWSTFIRSPKLDDDGTDPSEAKAWRALVGRT